MRIKISRDPFGCDQAKHPLPFGDHVAWPVNWLASPYQATAFQLVFELAQTATVRIHFSFNEMGELYLDGELLERGPERSDANHWRYVSHELKLAAGRHRLTARNWCLGDLAPWGQMNAGKVNFVLAAEEPMQSLLSTGLADWQMAEIPGLAFAAKATDAYVTATGVSNIFTLSDYTLDAAGIPWRRAEIGDRACPGCAAWHFSNPPCLEPAMLPAMKRQKFTAGKAVAAGQFSGEFDFLGDFAVASADGPMMAEADRFFRHQAALTIPPRRHGYLLIDLEDYHNFYYNLQLSGTGKIAVEFAEALFDSEAGGKQNRFAVAGQHWRQPHGDLFIAGATANSAMPVYPRCGRYLVLRYLSLEQPLVIEKIECFEHGYPLNFTAIFTAAPDYFSRTMPKLQRTVELCTFDATVDCPFYEQLMYVGDTRVENLIIAAMTGDDRLLLNSLRQFAASRDFRGLTASSYPVRSRQTIPGYSLLWIPMLHDAVLWSRDAIKLAPELVPAMRGILDYFEHYRDPATKLMISPPGWNFVDWVNVPEWPIGVPPGGAPGEISGVGNLLYLYTLRHAVLIEEAFGSKDYMAFYQARFTESAAAILKHFWSKERQLFADDLDKQYYSEHAQLLALLADAFPAVVTEAAAQQLFATPNGLSPAGYYFSFYYFECCGRYRRIDRLIERYQELEAVIDRLNLKTAPENPGETRSDCHAWSASSLFHFYGTILGIRPQAGGQTLTIRPQLGPLQSAQGEMPLADGKVKVAFTQTPNGLTGTVELPGEVTATLIVNHQTATIRGKYRF